MKTESIEPVELPNGIYKGRLGGTIVSIRLPGNTTYKFKVDFDAAELSIGVFVTIKEKIASVISNGYY